MTFAVALLILLSRPDRLQNRALALVLGVEAFLPAAGSGLMYLTDDPASAYAWQIVAAVASGAALWTYLLFLSTIPVRLMQWSARASARAAFCGLALATAAWPVFWPHHFFTGVFPGSFAPWDSQFADIGRQLILATVATYVLGLVVTLAYYRSTLPGSPARSQAKAYLLAFVVRDVGMASLLLIPVLVGIDAYGLALNYMLAGTSLAFVLLLTYGILRSQLFDIDLKLKWTLRRGTLAAAFVGVFFVASEVAQLVLSDVAGPLAGILAAGLLLFAMAPLQRAADRMADSAMPRVRDTEEYRTVRKHEVYRATVEGALADGEITDRERDMLARLQDQLGLSGTEARAIERAVAQGTA